MGYKISDYPQATSVKGDDLILVVTDPTGVPRTKVVQVGKLFDNTTPVSSTISIKKGKILFDNDYLYIAIADNLLKRVPLQSFT